MSATQVQDRIEHLSEPGSSAGDSRTSRPGVKRVLAYAVLLALLVGAILGGRLIWHHTPPTRSVVSVAHPAAPVPTSPAVEAAWGIRFTNVIVLADNGGVELRYQALDDSTSARIHQGDAKSNQLPSITVDGTNGVVAPSAVLMHIHHGDVTAGRTYSIIYGNAGGVVKTGEYVTIVMKDGLKIEHIEVSN